MSNSRKTLKCIRTLLPQGTQSPQARNDIGSFNWVLRIKRYLEKVVELQKNNPNSAVAQAVIDDL